MLRRLSIATVVAALLASMSLTPAEAATRSVPDRRGDTTAPNDVTRVKVNNGLPRLRVAVEVSES